jgi:hypothetical protein
MTRIGAFNPDQAQRVWAATLAHERGGAARPDEKLFNEHEPILVRNTSGHTIPPFGLMQPKACFDQLSSYNYIDVVRPFDYDANLAVVLVNGFNEIEDGEYGTAQTGPVFRVRIQTIVLDGGDASSDLPIIDGGDASSFDPPLDGGDVSGSSEIGIGDRLGWINDSFDAGLGALFRVLGEDDIAENCLRVMLDFSSMQGQSILEIPAGGSGFVYRRKATVSGWATDTSKSYLAYNDTETAVTEDSRIIMFPIDGRWVIVEVC